MDKPKLIGQTTVNVNGHTAKVFIWGQGTTGAIEIRWQQHLPTEEDAEGARKAIFAQFPQFFRPGQPSKSRYIKPKDNEEARADMFKRLLRGEI